MKNKTLYDKTVSILVKAYLNDTLEHGNCQACAVGNLVAGNNGYKYKETFSGIQWSHVDHCEVDIFWYNVLGTQSGKRFLNKKKYTGDAKEQIDSTGYNIEELSNIEGAFEAEHDYEDDMMYRGLMAVVEVLGEIHSVSQEVTEETKLMFVK